MTEATARDLVPPDPGMVAAASAHADRRRAVAREAVRAHSGWTARYLLSYGMASLLFALGASLPGQDGVAAAASGVATTVFWLAFVVSVLYAWRRRVTSMPFFLSARAAARR